MAQCSAGGVPSSEPPAGSDVVPEPEGCCVVVPPELSVVDGGGVVAPGEPVLPLPVPEPDGVVGLVVLVSGATTPPEEPVEGCVGVAGTVVTGASVAGASATTGEVLATGAFLFSTAFFFSALSPPFGSRFLSFRRAARCN